MTRLTIELTAEERASVERRARQAGHTDAGSYVRALVIADDDYLPPEMEEMLIQRLEGPTLTLPQFKRRLNAKLKALKANKSAKK